VTRRGLIHGLLVILLGGDPAARLGRFGWRIPDVAAGPPAPSSGPVSSRPLSSPDLEDLVSFAGVLVEGRTLSPVEVSYLVDHIGYRVTQGPDYLSFYRSAITLINRMAGARFSSLGLDQRIALVTRYRLNSAVIWPDEDLGPSPDDARDVRTRVAPDLIGGYYGSPVGWAVVGYDAFPGRCADLGRYTGAGS
jgi:hypothetical protein